MAEDNVDVARVRTAVEREGAPWQAGETSVSQLRRDDRVRRLGAVPPPGVPSLDEMVRRARAGQRALAVAAETVGAPPAYDLRNVGGQNFVTPVRDQGNCGSCVAFGTVAAIEATYRRQLNDATRAVDLSEAHLFYCHARSQGYRCNTGWWPNEALEACKSIGVADDACYPYTDGDQDCTGRCADWQTRVTKITSHQALTSTAAMKEWISTKGALTACLVVFDDFFAYQGGVYRHVSGNQAGGHCVAMVGYDDAQGCWICKNSWGAGWGENGFFRIAYGDSQIDSWDVRGLEGVIAPGGDGGWLNNKTITGLWATDQDRNAWVYVSGLGWRRIASGSDAIFFTLLAQLAAAKAARRPVNLYQSQGVITQVYVL